MNHNTQACQIYCAIHSNGNNTSSVSTVRATMDHYVASVLHYLSCYYLGLLTQDEPSLSNHLLNGLLDHPMHSIPKALTTFERSELLSERNKHEVSYPLLPLLW